jgi:hypothetical protein
MSQLRHPSFNEFRRTLIATAALSIVLVGALALAG